MKKIFGEKRTGKTSELIKLSASNRGYIVCSDIDESHRILSLAINMGLDIPLPITYNEFLTKAYDANGVKSLLIDNVDRLMSYIAGNTKIEAITVSID